MKPKGKKGLKPIFSLIGLVNLITVGETAPNAKWFATLIR